MLITSAVEKLNLRLVRASEYLQQSDLNVYHKSKKLHIVSDALSRLTSTNKGQADPSDKLNAFYVYYTLLIEIKSNFKLKLIDSYQKDKPWRKVLKQLKELKWQGDNAAIILFLKELVYPQSATTRVQDPNSSMTQIHDSKSSEI